MTRDLRTAAATQPHAPAPICRSPSRGSTRQVSPGLVLPYPPALQQAPGNTVARAHALVHAVGRLRRAQQQVDATYPVIEYPSLRE